MSSDACHSIQKPEFDVSLHPKRVAFFQPFDLSCSKDVLIPLDFEYAWTATGSTHVQHQDIAIITESRLDTTKAVESIHCGLEKSQRQCAAAYGTRVSDSRHMRCPFAVSDLEWRFQFLAVMETQETAEQREELQENRFCPLVAALIHTANGDSILSKTISDMQPWRSRFLSEVQQIFTAEDIDWIREDHRWNTCDVFEAGGYVGLVPASFPQESDASWTRFWDLVVDGESERALSILFSLANSRDLDSLIAALPYFGELCGEPMLLTVAGLFLSANFRFEALKCCASLLGIEYRQLRPDVVYSAEDPNVLTVQGFLHLIFDPIEGKRHACDSMVQACKFAQDKPSARQLSRACSLLIATDCLSEEWIVDAFKRMAMEEGTDIGAGGFASICMWHIQKGDGEEVMVEWLDRLEERNGTLCEAIRGQLMNRHVC